MTPIKQQKLIQSTQIRKHIEYVYLLLFIFFRFTWFTKNHGLFVIPGGVGKIRSELIMLNLRPNI